MQDCKCVIKIEKNYLNGSAFAIVFLRAEHAGATVLICHSIPTGWTRWCYRANQPMYSYGLNTLVLPC